MADKVIEWLLQGDPSIRYQTERDLMGNDNPKLRQQIAREGWGARILEKRKPDGHWGKRFYNPKWTCTHYTLLDLRNLRAPPTEEITASVDVVVEEFTQRRPTGLATYTDTCVNGMALNYAAYFDAVENQLNSFVDFLIDDLMPDGGFNCRRSRSGARHSSLHSTLSVLEGFSAYLDAGHSYRAAEISAIIESCREFILLHRFFRSDHTGNVINANFLKFPTHPRYLYNILRALDYFASAGAAHDPRMDEALDIIVAKRRLDGKWKANTAKPGEIHFRHEETRRPSRIITLTALRVLHAYQPEHIAS